MKISYMKSFFVAATVFLSTVATAEICGGTAGTVAACVEPNEVTTTPTVLISDCVYLGKPDCYPFTVTYPEPSVGDDAYSLECGFDGPDNNCIPRD